MDQADLNLSMFKVYDIRTKSINLNKQRTSRLLRAIGRYYIEVLKTDTVVMGRDARLAAPTLLQEALDFFPEIGINVVVNPLQESTCLFYYSCMQHLDAAGIMFTASHNPRDYIGLKLIAPGMRTLATGCGPEGGIAKIKEYYVSDDWDHPASLNRGNVSIRSYTNEFIDYSMRLAGVAPGSLKDSKILLDFLNGAIGFEVAKALELAGASVRMQNLIPDGMFPKGEPNPVVRDSIKPTWDLMAKERYDFGFCFDGDGDRMDIMDNGGNQLAPAFNMTILAPEIEKIFRPAFDQGYFEGDSWEPQLYSDVKSNPLSMHDQAVGGMGVHIIRNGHSFIKESLRNRFKEQYLVASEETAHYYMNFPVDLDDFGKGFVSTENTLFFTLLTARLWHENPKAYRKAMKRQFSISRIREWPCHFLAEDRMENVMHDVENAFIEKGLKGIKTMDDGSDLDATLIRYGLPVQITAETKMEQPWYQVAQRISRSEEGMTRWEVVSNDNELCEMANSIIKSITDAYVAEGVAVYPD